MGEDLIGISEIGRLTGIARPNVYRWVQRRGLEPVRTDPLPVGKLYSRAAVLVAHGEWLVGRDRGQDEKRRASAIARRNT